MISLYSSTHSLQMNAPSGGAPITKPDLGAGLPQKLQWEAFSQAKAVCLAWPGGPLRSWPSEGGQGMETGARYGSFPNPDMGGPRVDFEDVVRHRRMVRHYTDEPVSVEDIEKLTSAALRAPSAGFTQGCRFLVIVAEADRRRFWSASGYVPPDERRAQVAGWLEQAPLIIVVLCSKAAYLARYSEPDKAWVPNDEADWEVPYWYVDAAFASMLVLLEAVNLGLGAMFMGVTAEFVPQFRAEFGVPEEFQPIGAVLVGHRHPDVRPNYRTDRRKPREQLVFYRDWGGSTL